MKATLTLELDTHYLSKLIEYFPDKEDQMYLTWNDRTRIVPVNRILNFDGPYEDE